MAKPLPPAKDCDLRPLGPKARAARGPAAPGHFAGGTPFVDTADCSTYVDDAGVCGGPQGVTALPASPPLPGLKARIEALKVAGVSIDKLVEQFGVNRDAIWRHCTKHMSDETKASYLLGAAQITSLANQAATEGRSVLDYLVIVRTILMNQLAREAELNKSYAVERVAGRLIDTLKEIGVTGEVSRHAATVFNIQTTLKS